MTSEPWRAGLSLAGKEGMGWEGKPWPPGRPQLILPSSGQPVFGPLPRRWEMPSLQGEPLGSGEEPLITHLLYDMLSTRHWELLGSHLPNATGPQAQECLASVTWDCTSACLCQLSAAIPSSLACWTDTFPRLRSWAGLCVLPLSCQGPTRQQVLELPPAAFTVETEAGRTRWIPQSLRNFHGLHIAVEPDGPNETPVPPFIRCVALNKIWCLIKSHCLCL